MTSPSKATSNLIPSLKSLATWQAVKKPIKNQIDKKHKDYIELPTPCDKWIEIFKKFGPGVFENLHNPENINMLNTSITSLNKTEFLSENTQKMLLDLIRISSKEFYDLFDDEGKCKLFDELSKNSLLSSSTEEIKSLVKNIRLREKNNIVDAAKENNIDLVNHFINIKVNIDRKINSRTALITAVEKSFFAIVHKLIEAEANLNLQDDKGKTALMLLVEEDDLWTISFQDYFECVQKLIKAGTDLNLQDNNGKTALMRAVEKSHINIVQKFIEAETNLNLQDKDGKTALMLAAKSRSFQCAQELIEAGAALDLQDKYGKTALMTAVGYVHSYYKGHCILWDWEFQNEFRTNALKFVQKSVKAGANLNLQDKDGNTALMLAAKMNHIEIEKELQNAIIKQKDEQ